MTGSDWWFLASLFTPLWVAMIVGGVAVVVVTVWVERRKRRRQDCRDRKE